MQPDKFAKTVIQWHEKLKKVTFTNLDYREILAEAREGDFVYMDPPYANNKQRYCADISTDELYDELEKLNRKGVKWAMSFDGSRADKEYEASMPSSLYERKLLVESGLSAVKKVLSGVNERVFESLYVNY
jgi:DNA adenine methylase